MRVWRRMLVSMKSYFFNSPTVPIYNSVFRLSSVVRRLPDGRHQASCHIWRN